MSDIIPIALFLLSLLATFGFVHVCERLRPLDARSVRPAEQAGAGAAAEHLQETPR